MPNLSVREMVELYDMVDELEYLCETGRKDEAQQLWDHLLTNTALSEVIRGSTLIEAHAVWDETWQPGT